MLHAGLDLSRRKLDVCLLSDEGEIVDEFAVPPDADGLAGLVRRVGPEAPQAVIVSMTGARFVHDRLEELGWDVRIADAAKVKGIGPLAAKTDKIDARVLAVLSQRDLIPEIWLPSLEVRQERELARFRLHLVKHKSMLKHRVHATLISFGKPCDSDRRGPLTKTGPKFLRWAMLEATMHALRHPAYADRYQRTKRRLGKQRGAKVAQIDIARRLTRSLWHMLTYDQPFHPQIAAGGAALRQAA